MLFNSYQFIFIFLPATLIVFFTLARLGYLKIATGSLVLASIIFYSYWNISYLPLLVVSICFNFMIGKKIEKAKTKGYRSLLLILGIVVDLALIAYFKYADFFIQTIDIVFNADLVISQIILPIGISFYTFTQLAYLVDTYRGETEGYDFLTYSLFVTFFPHLIAGPILYHKNIIPQFYQIKNYVFSHENFASGITIFVLGLSKKMLMADQLIPWVKPVFEQAAQVTFLEAWIGALAYTFQLYFDFSGYSDMAVGLGLMLNINLPINFNSPYKSTSIIEFWKRWHISLSEFLKSYLYISLGGNRFGQLKKMRNIMITMLLGGLWHGAGWTYVIWGGLHGFYLVVNHTWRNYQLQLPKFLSWLITTMAVIVAWVFFRANSVNDACSILKTMFGYRGIALTHSDNKVFSQLLILFLIFLWVKFLPNTQELISKVINKKIFAIALGIFFGICILLLNQVSEFLYFQF